MSVPKLGRTHPSPKLWRFEPPHLPRGLRTSVVISHPLKITLDTPLRIPYRPVIATA